jgi:hypothetical protein
VPPTITIFVRLDPLVAGFELAIERAGRNRRKNVENDTKLNRRNGDIGIMTCTIVKIVIKVGGW